MLANAIARVWLVALWVLDIRDRGGCGDAYASQRVPRATWGRRIDSTSLFGVYLPRTAPIGQIHLKIYRGHHTPGQADPGGDEPDRPHDAENSLLECARSLH